MYAFYVDFKINVVVLLIICISLINGKILQK